MNTVKIFSTLVILFILVIDSSSQPSEYRMNRQEYIERFKDEAIREMLIHKIPASITLAQGILESGDGNSPLARYANNHFGIKCHKGWTGPTFIQDDDTKNECFRKYQDPNESYRDHSEFLLKPRYAELFSLKITDYQGWAKGLKKAGYATNPKYPELLIKIIEDNNLHEFDKINKLPDSRPNNPSVVAAAPGAVQLKNTAASLNVSLNNNVKFVLARQGDSPESIAKELLMKPWQIYKYNGFHKGHEINEGDIIYLQPKKNKGNQPYHVMAEGESLQEVSQKHGVKLSKICAYNFLEPESLVHPGEKVYLRKVKNK